MTKFELKFVTLLQFCKKVNLIFCKVDISNKSLFKFISVGFYTHSHLGFFCKITFICSRLDVLCNVSQWCCTRVLLSALNKLAQHKRHASQVHFAKIHCKKIHFGNRNLKAFGHSFWKIYQVPWSSNALWHRHSGNVKMWPTDRRRDGPTYSRR